MKRFLLNWWTLTIFTAVLMAVILAFVLPIFVHFLRPWWVRLLLILLVALVWGAFALVRVLRARKGSDEIAKELAKPADQGDAEAQVQAKRMADAIASLKQSTGNRRDYLYSRPWYVIIGPPGAGKTTALLNSGLRFPFADSALKGVGGTRNLDFWFADEAALVDTAGRYTTQDSDAIADSRAWEHFLGLLRKHRPLQPINGVLVAIGIDELMRADRIGLDAHASAVRRRLNEVQRTLEVAAPVYVLFTKADLLAGFVEYYDDLDVEGRRAVLGATLPAGAPATAQALAGEFDLFAQGVSARMSKRLQEEPDPRRRGLILGFPSQVEALRARVLRFLDGAFPAEAELKAPLRGFYFTSGVQEGAPLDRLLSGMAQVYDAPQAAARGQGSGGRAYFLNRLLHEVVFAEAGLVQADPRAKRRRQVQLMAGFGGIAAVVVLTLILWTVSFGQNRALQDKLFAGAKNVQQAIQSTGVDPIEVRETDPDLEQTLSILRALKGLPRGYGAKKGAPLFMTFGLYQGELARAARQAYLDSLQRIMLPRVLLRLERYLRDNQSNAQAIYEPLKAYMMLGSFHALDHDTVKDWVEDDWATASYSGADREPTRKELADHLEALLADKDLGRVWAGRKAPLDGQLIASSQQAVQNMQLYDRAYAIMKQKAVGQGSAWQASTVLTRENASAFANPDAVLAMQVPYFYTTKGYAQSYLAGMATVQEDLAKDLWVLGSDADTASIRSQLVAIRPGVQADYVRDYDAAWEAVLKTPQPADYAHSQQALAAFTQNPSPYKLLIQQVKANTTFTGSAGNPLVAAAAKLAAIQPGAGGPDAASQISNNFKATVEFSIDDFINNLKSQYSATAAAAFAGGGAAAGATQAQVAQSSAQLAQSAAGAPPLLQGFVAQAAKGGQAAAASSAAGAVADAYQRQVQASCHSVVDNAYPFFGAAQSEASVRDMLQLFGAGGQFDNFQRASLSGLLDTAGPTWRWNPADPTTGSLHQVSAEQLQLASQIRDLMTTGLPLKIEVRGAGSFGGAVTGAEFSVSGTAKKFEAATVGGAPFMWSPNGLQEAHVTLFSGDKPIKTFSFQGPWALFRLMDGAKRENAGPSTIKATFGDGATFASLFVTLPSTTNPFNRAGMWSFRCPAAL